MINKQKKSKKSTTKKHTFKISPLIPIIAIIEVIILVVISSYAWFFVQASKVIGSGTISVDADSGLDIDFQYSNIDDYINIWNYVGQDFKFEPATSLDGRNIYFPTSGTFDNSNTQNIVLRDGTVNDINSKYLSIDFELTNTSDYDQYVYLNNNSFFTVKQGEELQESRALRLAFYQNDGNSGNVGSSMLDSSNGSSDGDSGSTNVSADSYTLYFDNSSSNWGTVYAYFYDSDDGNPIYHTAWPGIQMSRVNGKTYSLTIDNPATNHGVKYDKVIFNNNTGTQTATFSLTSSEKGHKYTTAGDQGAYSENTVYFLKPSSWTNDNGDVYCHAWTGSGSSTNAYTTWPGDKMQYVGSGLYAYSYDSDHTGGFLFNNNNDTNRLDWQTQDISIDANTNGSIYYCDGGWSSGKRTVTRYTTYSYAAMPYSTVYLFNTYGWTQPYATVSVSGATDESLVTSNIALTSLSGSVYYCTVPAIFDTVYFRQKDQTAINKRTEKATVNQQMVYRPLASTGSFGYQLTTFYYSSYIMDEGYPVISPGVSAGFQRPYSPVITIDAISGLATEIIPAYSNSIDNYILGSGTPLFTLKANHMASLSMIMWLEGTDSACVGDLYPGNTIDFKLEFSTLYYTSEEGSTQQHIVNPGDSASYIYNFYDRTREIWTSNRQSTESGVTVAPVMQLYDNTTKRGYRMSPSATTSYDGKQKTSCWSVEAPRSIALLGHDIIFRRVNPYDEDEVWNYWHAGPVAGNGSVSTNNLTVYDVAFSNGNTVSFTAFADGSPTDENLTAAYLNTHASDASNPTAEELEDAEDAVAAAGVPPLSCGGLWGNHSVRLVTLVDGMNGQPLRNNDGIVTVKYSFPYKVDNTTLRTATIEYKASGPEYNSLYYIVMPAAAYTNGLTCTFKNYTNFNGSYAINSDRNDRITFQNSYGDNQAISGDYCQLSRKTNGDDVTFWGSDLLIVQTSSETQSHYFTGQDRDRLTQVHFYSNSTPGKTGAHTSGDQYTFLYYNSQFNSNDGTGFVTVVPNDRTYYKYSVELCPYSGSENGSKLRHMSELQTLTYTTQSIVDSQGGTYTMKINHLNGDNVCKLQEVWAYIYLQTNYKAVNKDPRVYNYCSDSSVGEAWSWWNSWTMTSVGAVSGTDMWMYRYALRTSKYDMAIFFFPQQYNKQGNAVSVSVTDAPTGQIYQCNSYSNGNPYVQKLNDTYAGLTEKDDTTVTLYKESKWPHYTAQATP